MLPIEWQNARRILVIRLDNIGDVVMLSPALRILHSHLPNASITLMASPAGSQVAPLLPGVDRVIVQRVVWQDASWVMPLAPAREESLIAKIEAENFDAALIFTSFSQSPYPPAYICYLAGIPLRIGQSKEFGGSVLSQWVKPLPDGCHQVDRNLFLLESAGFIPEGRHLELAVTEEMQKNGDRLLLNVDLTPNQPFIILAPGASCAARRYDIQRFATVASMLAAESKLKVVVVGSDRETDLFKPILNNRNIVSLVGKTSIPELAAIVKRSSLVIANNSGTMHIADAFLKPMVVLYSGTELESQWQPRNAPTKLLRRFTECSPCYGFECPYQMECLDISPDEVVREAVKLLEESFGMVRYAIANAPYE
ncbi:glycosyltransferase family 9 protein [Floridanema aerugineum]|uniref:Glycosyltransferase family 9 protein n=1 Tax=Floridaenema aerugineum BLCC-F46 TaxID=3153654 RepID=A0ABV4XA30_9CYAN